MPATSPECPPSVKIATPDTEESLMALLRLMHLENGMAAFNDDKVRTFLKRGLSRDHAIIGVIKDKSDIVASVGLFVGEWWYSRAQHVEDFWLFVHPNFRGGGKEGPPTSHARDLIAFAKWAAKKLEYPLLLGVLSGKRTDAKVRLYQRQLGPPKGALFVVE